MCETPFRLLAGGAVCISGLWNFCGAVLLSWAEEFRRLRAATYFAHGGKVGKTPPGPAPDEHSVLIVAFPRPRITGDAYLSGFAMFPARKI